jgi:hypothetical protein
MDMNQFVPYDVIEPSPEAPAGREPQSQPNAILDNLRTFSRTSFRPSKHLFEQEPAPVFQTRILTTRHITTIATCARALELATCPSGNSSVD